MSPAWIRPRKVNVSAKNPRGKSFQVLFRRGGRGYRIETAGTFKTEKDARLRRDLVAGWLAQGLDPRAELAKLQAPPAKTRTYAEWANAYSVSRIDIAAGTSRALDAHLKRLLPLFGDADPYALTVAEQIEAVAVLAANLSPASLAGYWATHRLILDFAGVDPNPARSQAVKLPAIVTEEITPPTAPQFLAVLAQLGGRWRLPFVLIEQTAMTVNETATLAWGDVDVGGCQLRLQRRNVKAQIRSRARWVQVPEWLMLLLDETCPLEDRVAERPVFLEFTPDRARNAMTRACLLAKVPHFHPHDLRHRRLSLWHGQGVPARELAARAGHSKASMTLDVYSHVMPLEEADAELLAALVEAR